VFRDDIGHVSSSPGPSRAAIGGVPSSSGDPSPTSTRTVASPSFRTVISSGNRTRALGSACLSFRGRFTQNSHTPPLGVAQALLALFRADPLGVPRATPVLPALVQISGWAEDHLPP
jgi:hypothetical protein